MSVTENILEHTFVYRTWQAPFVEQKFAPVLEHNDLSSVCRVLDVGCGPGTNTAHFSHSDYVGIDINERYIQYAIQLHARRFVAADVRGFHTAPGDRFDFVLANSFLHHLNTHDVLGILSHLSSLVSDDGHVHVLELVLPPDKSIARLLAKWDRGNFVRSREEWETIFDTFFESVLTEFYQVTCIGMTLWNMVYFKGRPKR